MRRYVLRRLSYAITVLVVVTTLTFVLFHLAPGGPSILADPKLSPVERAAVERQLGLDQPLWVQYVRWNGQLLSGNLGRSFLYHTSNVSTILTRLPNTLLLSGFALLVSLLVAVPLGIYAALHPGRPVDRMVDWVSALGLSMPTFWLGILLIILFAAQLHLLPAGGRTTPGVDTVGDRILHLVLPVAVLGFALAAEMIRYVRSNVRLVAHQNYVRTARAKGLGEWTTLRRHVVRNTLVSLLTLVGLQIPALVGGAAVTETVFSWPGMGRLIVEAALSRDYPLVMAITLLVAGTVISSNLIVDLLYRWADPRVRLE